jgi:hypothetical protein
MTTFMLTIGVGKPHGSKRTDLYYARNSADKLASSTWGDSAKPESPLTLIDKKAKVIDVKERLSTLATAAKEGDRVCLSFSGHGRGFNETVSGWHLYDDFLKGEKIEEWLREFEKGVKVTVVSDCCYAGDLLSGLSGRKAYASVTAISATGANGLAFPEQEPERPEQAVSALVDALGKVQSWSPAAGLEEALREELKGKVYRQVPVVKEYASA